MGHGHDSDHPPANPGCDHDHECQNCGAALVAGLAACPYCRTGYVGVAAGPRCPACDCLSLAGRTACAHCEGALTRACVFCMAHSFIDQPTCARCHEPFEGAEARRRARLGSPTAVPHKADPTGANIFNTLNSILKS